MHSTQNLGPWNMFGSPWCPARVKDYECERCKDFHDDKEEVKYVKLGNDMIEVVQKFAT